MALILCVQAAAPDQTTSDETSDTGVVTGRVTDRAGSPLPGATVQFRNKPDRGPSGAPVTAATNERGSYEIRLDPGTYVAEAVKAGYVRKAFSARESTAMVRSTVKR